MSTTTPKCRIPDVETQECEGLPVGPHELTNHGPITRCRWCQTDWATLDAELRDSLSVTLTT